MPTYQLAGESLVETMPAHVETLKIFGVEVFRIIGTDEQVSASTKILDERYTAMHAFGDAQHIGYCHGADKRPQPMYELIVVRKVFPNERKD